MIWFGASCSRRCNGKPETMMLNCSQTGLKTKRPRKTVFGRMSARGGIQVHIKYAVLRRSGIGVTRRSAQSLR